MERIKYFLPLAGVMIIVLIMAIGTGPGPAPLPEPVAPAPTWPDEGFNAPLQPAGTAAEPAYAPDSLPPEREPLIRALKILIEADRPPKD